MHHHFTTYYDIDKKMREDNVARHLQQQQWVKDATCCQPRRLHRIRAFFTMLVGFFI